MFEPGPLNFSMGHIFHCDSCCFGISTVQVTLHKFPAELCWLQMQSHSNVVQGLVHRRQNQYVRTLLIDLRDIPTEDRPVFFEQTMHIPDQVFAVCIHFQLFHLYHVVFVFIQ